MYAMPFRFVDTNKINAHHRPIVCGLGTQVQIAQRNDEKKKYLSATNNWKCHRFSIAAEFCAAIECVNINIWCEIIGINGSNFDRF